MNKKIVSSSALLIVVAFGFNAVYCMHNETNSTIFYEVLNPQNLDEILLTKQMEATNQEFLIYGDAEKPLDEIFLSEYDALKNEIEAEYPSLSKISQWADSADLNQSASGYSLLCHAIDCYFDLAPVLNLFAEKNGPSENIRFEVIKLLIAKGADVSIPNGSWGLTPMGCCLLREYSEGQLEMLQLLLNNNAHVNARDPRGRTALMYAAITGSIEHVKLLMQHGATLDLIDNQGEDALMHAIEEKLVSRAKLVGFFLQQGVFDINRQNRLGGTCLMKAAANGDFETVKLLLKTGALALIKNNENWRALDEAEDRLAAIKSNRYNDKTYSYSSGEKQALKKSIEEIIVLLKKAEVQEANLQV